MSIDPLVAIELVAAAAAYVWAAGKVPRWDLRRTLLFLAGLAAIGVALGPLDAAADGSLSGHMAQHLTLVLVAPPLLLLGAPLRLVLTTAPPPVARRFVRGARGRAVRTLLRPSVALTGFAAIVVGTHIPAFYELALRSGGAHVVEHLLYLLAGFLLWAPVLAPPPLPRMLSPLGRVIYLFVAMAPGTAVALWLMDAGGVRYGSYVAEAGSRAAAYADQGRAGWIMWAVDAALMGAAAVAVGWSAVVAEEERQRIRDAHALRSPLAPPGAGPEAS